MHTTSTSTPVFYRLTEAERSMLRALDDQLVGGSQMRQPVMVSRNPWFPPIGEEILSTRSEILADCLDGLYRGTWFVFNAFDGAAHRPVDIVHNLKGRQPELVPVRSGKGQAIVQAHRARHAPPAPTATSPIDALAASIASVPLAVNRDPWGPNGPSVKYFTLAELATRAERMPRGVVFARPVGGARATLAFEVRAGKAGTTTLWGGHAGTGQPGRWLQAARKRGQHPARSKTGTRPRRRR